MGRVGNNSMTLTGYLDIRSSTKKEAWFDPFLQFISYLIYSLSLLWTYQLPVHCSNDEKVSLWKHKIMVYIPKLNLVVNSQWGCVT